MCKSKQQGITLVELLVSILIGMLALYAVYLVFDGTEQAKRNVTTTGEAQISGLYATFLLSQESTNAGAGLMASGRWLANCPNVGTGIPGDTGLGTVNVALSLRPLAAIIRQGAQPLGGGVQVTPDEVVVFYGRSPSYSTWLPIAAVDATTISVNAIDGFAQGETLIIVPQNNAGTAGAGNCVALPTMGAVPAVNGIATVPLPLGTTGITTNDAVVALGVPVKNRYFVQNNTLMVQEWVLNARDQWRLNRTDPLVANVVRFYAQYGIDNNADGNIDAWVMPDDSSGNDWSIDVVRALPWQDAATPTQEIKQIRALRIALVIQADEPDRNLADDGAGTNDFQTTFFRDCPGGIMCPVADVITVDIPQPAGIPYGWRYRAYETVIPLKNTIWNQDI